VRLDSLQQIRNFLVGIFVMSVTNAGTLAKQGIGLIEE
jgi:hypothetical protein